MLKSDSKNLELYDFMCDDTNDTFIPPAVMEGYVEQEAKRMTLIEMLNSIPSNTKAIIFGLSIGLVFAVKAIYSI
jgi:hypothetical protein